MDVTAFFRHCGSKIISNFWYPHHTDPIASNVKTMFGIFINEPEQKLSYEKLKKKFKILYQSPILERKRSTDGHPYFIVIWLNEKP